MSRVKRYVIALVIAGIVFGASTSFAAVTTSCSLGGAKLKDSPFEWSTGGKYVTLSMSCASNSSYGTMAVIRGRKTEGGSAIWLMYPALKCEKGRSNSIKKDIEAYASTHGGVAFSNQFGVRQYGNHCDNQKTGCYGTASATNTNS